MGTKNQRINCIIPGMKRSNSITDGEVFEGVPLKRSRSEPLQLETEVTTTKEAKASIPLRRSGLSGSLDILSLAPTTPFTVPDVMPNYLKALPKGNKFNSEQVSKAISIQRLTRGFQVRRNYEREIWIAYNLFDFI